MSQKIISLKTMFKLVSYTCIARESSYSQTTTKDRHIVTVKYIVPVLSRYPFWLVMPANEIVRHMHEV